ncbi:hypothetical protein BKA70DRAFT_398740 [Coprinopsis sp. MPI-PUGE-AT-0042]|nr:hypothetical protein BKA70DRAFT_398740 [Coprinopsis sp. MPI-PUGE-AT-0042]
MLEVEDWTQPSQNKRRVSSRKVTAMEKDHNDISPSALGMLRTSPPMPTNALPVEVEDKFHLSNAYPARGRSNSSPAARPSSLSRLLAQASPIQDGLSAEPPTVEGPQRGEDSPSMPDPEPAEPSIPEPSVASSVPEAAVVSPPAESQAVTYPISPPPQSPFSIHRLSSPPSGHWTTITPQARIESVAHFVHIAVLAGAEANARCRRIWRPQ